MPHLSRRTLLAAAGAATAALCLGALRTDALARGSARRGGRDALEQAVARAVEIRKGARSLLGWQDAMAELWAETDVASLLHDLDVDRLLQGRPLAKRGASVVVVPWWKLLPEASPPPGFAVKVFAFGPGRANPPHAHEHMVSTHLVLRGRFRVTHHEKVRHDLRHAWLRPSVDRELLPGDSTSISDARDNVHAHRTQTGGLLLDVVVAELGGETTATPLLDVARAEKEGDLLRAPRVESVEEALARYG